MPPRRNAKPNTEQLPPHSPEAEAGVLGCLLLFGKAVEAHQAVSECAARFKAGADVFYDPRHVEIYRAMLDLYERRDPIDLIAVKNELKNKRALEDAGGIAYLSELPDLVPSAANLAYYVDIVADKYQLRRLLQLSTRVQRSAQDYEGDVAELVSEVEREILAVRQERVLRGRGDIQAIQKALIDKYEAAANRKTPPGLLFQYPDFDLKSGGWQEQEYNVLGGFPSAGKTSLALGLVLRAVRQGVGASVFSLETSNEKLTHRLNCIAGHVDGAAFMRGSANQAEMERMSNAIQEVNSLRHLLFLHDVPLNEDELFALARRDYAEGARFFVLDYLQLLKCPGDGDVERVSRASMACKILAKELNAPVLALSALSRQGELKQSGDIDYGADRILLLECDDPTKPIRRITCNFKKNKDNETGPVWFTFFAAEYRMEQASRVEDDDVPETRRGSGRKGRPWTQD